MPTITMDEINHLDGELFERTIITDWNGDEQIEDYDGNVYYVIDSIIVGVRDWGHYTNELI